MIMNKKYIVYYRFGTTSAQQARQKVESLYNDGIIVQEINEPDPGTGRIKAIKDAIEMAKRENAILLVAEHNPLCSYVTPYDVYQQSLN